MDRDRNYQYEDNNTYANISCLGAMLKLMLLRPINMAYRLCSSACMKAIRVAQACKDDTSSSSDPYALQSAASWECFEHTATEIGGDML